jgi:hypothetical protein
MQIVSLNSTWAEEEKRASLHRLEEDNARGQEKKFAIDLVHEIAVDVIEIENVERWTRNVKETKKGLGIETETVKSQANQAVSMKETETEGEDLQARKEEPKNQRQEADQDPERSLPN